MAPVHCCQTCGKKFDRPSKLKNHQRMHTGEKPHVCKLCGKAYKQKEGLVIHERIHTGEKPFTCKICSKAFSNPSHRNRHARIHSVEERSASSVGETFALPSSSNDPDIVQSTRGNRLHLAKDRGGAVLHRMDLINIGDVDRGEDDDNETSVCSVAQESAEINPVEYRQGFVPKMVPAPLEQQRVSRPSTRDRDDRSDGSNEGLVIRLVKVIVGTHPVVPIHSYLTSRKLKISLNQGSFTFDVRRFKRIEMNNKKIQFLVWSNVLKTLGDALNLSLSTYSDGNVRLTVYVDEMTPVDSVIQILQQIPEASVLEARPQHLWKRRMTFRQPPHLDK